MTAIAPLLLDEKAARDLLGGIDPERVAPPIRYGRQKRWAREALEKAIARAVGLDAPAAGGDEKSSAYDKWKASQ